MNYIYTHLPQNEDIGFLERSYSVIEGMLEYKGRGILYLLVDASDITFCDRSHAAHLASVNVKGYVVRAKYETNKAGEAMSEIEPIEDEGDKRAITNILRSRHNIATVNYF